MNKKVNKKALKICQSEGHDWNIYPDRIPEGWRFLMECERCNYTITVEGVEVTA